MTNRLIITALLLALSVLSKAQDNIQANNNLLNCRIEPSMIIEMSSAVEGVISKVFVDVNDEVKAGEILAQLNSQLELTTLELRKVQAELNSDIQAKTLSEEFSQRNLKRIQNLYAKKAASFSELDKAKTENAIAKQELQQALDRRQQAKLEYNRAQADLNRRTIRSPIDGIIVERYKQPGEHIDFDPVLKIVQLDPLIVEVFAPASIYGKIKQGMKADVFPRLNGSKKSYQATVELVDKVIDAPSNTFTIKLILDNPRQALPSGIKCKIKFKNIDINLLG